jgi:uncharacterized protein (TIGR03083 family)
MTEGTDGLAEGTFAAAAAGVLPGLSSLVDADWSVPAGELEWSCWQTADHVIDCLLSYCLQVGARRADGWLPLQEVHAQAGATPRDLLDALASVSRLFSAVLATSPPDVTASDGVTELGVTDWAIRGAYELVVHGHDIAAGLGRAFEPPADLCARVLASSALWMLDRNRAAAGTEPWDALLLASGRGASGS